MEKDQPVLFYNKNLCVIISYEDAETQCAECRAKFDGHERIHRNKGKHYVVTDDGRCEKCGIGDCRPIRVRVLRSVATSNADVAAFPRHATAANWKHLKVKNKRRPRKDQDRYLVEAIEPKREWIQKRIADLRPTRNAEFFTKLGNPDRIQFNNNDALVERIRLEIEAR
jgi:hypothetical protein